MLYNSCRYVEDYVDCTVSLKITTLNIAIGCQIVCVHALFEYNDRLRTHIKCLRTTQKTNRTQGVLAGTGRNDLKEFHKISKLSERESV